MAFWIAASINAAAAAAVTTEDDVDDDAQKMSLSANPYKRKGFIWIRIENNFHMSTKTLKLTSIWKIGLGQIANGFWIGINDNGDDDALQVVFQGKIHLVIQGI